MPEIVEPLNVNTVKKVYTVRELVQHMDDSEADYQYQFPLDRRSVIELFPQVHLGQLPQLLIAYILLSHKELYRV